jgi:hypothetical protein
MLRQARFAWKAFAQWQRRLDKTEEEKAAKKKMFRYLSGMFSLAQRINTDGAQRSATPSAVLYAAYGFSGYSIPSTACLALKTHGCNAADFLTLPSPQP